METFLIYLLKSSGIIALFLLFYILFLKRETFFRTNRIYLLAGLGFAIIVPFLIFTKTIWIQPMPMHQIRIPDELNVAPAKADSIDWIALILYGYFVGVFLFSIRFAVQLLSLKKLMGSGKKIRDGKFVRIETDQKSSPFSFFTYLIYNPTLHTPSELKTILAHEGIHAQKRHSLDILFIQLFTIFQWCNPFVWWYQVCLGDNLEYLADTETVTKNTDKTEYQYLLLLAGMGKKYYPMTTPFFNHSIKKRIIMLNKNKSDQKSSLKYALMLPLLAGFIFLFNIRTEAQIDPSFTSNNTESPKTDNIQPPSHNDDEYNPVTYNKEHTGDFPIYNINSNDNIDKPDDILKITKNELPRVYVNDKTPLYLVDGKEMSKTDFETIDPNSIESISEWRGQQAIDIYGEKGKNGAIEITLKKNYLNIPKTNYRDSLKIQIRSISAANGNKPRSDIGAANPLYKLDGKEISKSDFEKIDSETIGSINVLKGKKAIEAYGDKGKEGVIEIKTKSKWKIGVGLNIFNPKSTAFEYYQQMEKSAPSDNPFPDIDKSLILINGVPSSKNDLKSITADQIKMLYPTRAGNEDAIKKYGDRAKNGIIEIITQKE